VVIDDHPNEREHLMSRAKTITITVGSLAAGALLATGITGIASAANGTPSPSASSGSTQANPQGRSNAQGDAKPGQSDSSRSNQGRHGGPGGPREGMGGHRGAMMGGPGGQALHGEIVIKAADGTISTVRLIEGTVTEVGTDSITVKAADNFTATYTVNATTDIHVGLPTRGQRPDAPGSTGTQSSAPAASTLADVKVGDVARVEGTVSGSTATATEIHSLTAAQAAELDTLRQQHDAQRGTQAPTSGATSSSSSSAA
jgi:hypothetical protein